MSDLPSEETVSPPVVTGRGFIQEVFSPAYLWLWVSATIFLTILVIWLTFTPQGLLGKADAIGYAVCHRITVRSFAFPDGRQLPMCARCSGTFLGVLVGMLVPGALFRRRHAAQFPPLWIIAILVTFSGWWAFDGFNSFTHLLPAEWDLPILFYPNNFLRVTTGTLHGITMGTLILPVINSTLWADASGERTIKNGWELAGMVAIGLALIAMMYSEYWLFLYPLAVLSSVGVLSVLGGIMTVVAATLLGKDNASRTLWEALPLIILGMSLALLAISLIDAGRFFVFGSWDGLIVN